MGFENYSVSELREKLVESGQLTVEEAEAIKGKANLVYQLIQRGIVSNEDEDEEVVEDIEPYANIDVEPLYYTKTPKKEEHEKDEPEVVKISPSHIEWNDYVLSQFDASELFEINGNKYPSLSGLRRVTELLLGDIVFSGPVDYKVTHQTEIAALGSCSVLYEVQILWKLDMPEWLSEAAELPTKTFRGLAGANQNNIDGDFALYPESIGEARAEARALRKALSLNVAAYEELTTKKAEDVIKPTSSTTGEWSSEDKISEVQSNAINFKCEQLGVDVTKFINSGMKQYGSLNEVNKATAAAMIKELSKYQQTGADGKDIPESIKIG